MTYPDGGETWTIGKTYNITWYEVDDRTWSAGLEYSTDGGVTWRFIDNVEPSSPGWKNHAWTIPYSVTPTAKARIRILNHSGSSSSGWQLQAADGSERNFTIAEPVPAACKGDLDGDGDVDGSDLATFAAGGTGITLEEFAADFGRTDCP